MVIRCSLLGHDYGDSEIEREREERGSEVVVTLREVEECSRCGNRSLVSENKEVTSIEPVDPEPAATGGNVDGDESEPAAVDSATESGAALEDTPPQDPATDDGVILEDDDEESPDRQYGQWPEADDEPADGATKPQAWPEVEGDDEGFDARPADDEAVDVGFNGGLTPEAEQGPVDDDAQFIEATDPNAGSQFEADASATGETDESSADPGPTDPGTGIASAPESRSPDSDVPGEFVCPRCDFVRNAAGSSLRAGDICPDCRRGYLTEQNA